MDTCPFLGSLLPLFWISGDVSSGFQSQSGFCLIHFFAEAMECTFPEIHLWCCMCWPLGSWQCSWWLPHMHKESWDLAQIQTGKSPGQKTNALPLCQPSGYAPSKPLHDVFNSAKLVYNLHGQDSYYEYWRKIPKIGDEQIAYVFSIFALLFISQQYLIG